MSGTPKFEKYYEYLEPQETTDKERLVEQFKKFLDDPDVYGGFFVVRWKENDTMYNNTTLNQFVANIR